MSLIKKLYFALPFILFSLVVILLWQGLALHPNQVPSPLMNKPAPIFRLPNLLGSIQPVTNQDFDGHVTLFNVWATWCSVCAEEHNFLLQLAQKEHVIIYGLNYKDDANAAIRWLKQYGNPYQLVAFDATGETGIDWGVYGTPETFIIDKKSLIRYKYVGALTPEVWQQKIKPLIQQLQAEAL